MDCTWVAMKEPDSTWKTVGKKPRMISSQPVRRAHGIQNGLEFSRLWDMTEQHAQRYRIDLGKPA
jgi:hypothetical protein